MEPDWLAKARAEGRILSDRQVRANMAVTPGLPGLTATEAGPTSQRFELPYPPTVNTYWRSVVIKEVAQYYVSPVGKKYQKLVKALFLAQHGKMMSGSLKFQADFHAPDKRRRDLDNLLKSIIDALAQAGAYEDDKQIQHIDVQFGKPLKGGMAYVTLTQLPS